MPFAGIDVGSLATKSAVIDDDGHLLAYAIVYTGASARKAAEVAFKEALVKAGLKGDGVRSVVSTGYGRELVAFADSKVTEITCHGRGAHSFFPEVRTIIDIGCQDSKTIRINEGGKVLNFCMNDRCAAGTGRFLEVMARALEVDLEELGDLSLIASQALPVSSMCTVFAESEVISLISQGHEKEDIIAGIHNSITKRILSMMARVGKEERVAMTGGVAKNIGMVRGLEEALKTQLLIPEEPQITGALGAALIAAERYAVASGEAVSSHSS